MQTKTSTLFSCFMMSNSVALPKLNERTQIWKFFHFVGNYNSSREYLTISFTHMLLVTSVFLTFWFLYFLMGRGEVILHVKCTLVEKMRLTVVFCLSHFVRVLPRKLINSTRVRKKYTILCTEPKLESNTRNINILRKPP